MIMKRINSIILTLLLLTAGAGVIQAQTISGRVESSNKEEQMTFTFWGGKVTSEHSDGINTLDTYVMEVIEGATLNFECEDALGNNWQMYGIVYGTWQPSMDHLVEKTGNGSVRMSFKVPQGQDSFCVQFGFSRGLKVTVRCRVVKRYNPDDPSSLITTSGMVSADKCKLTYKFTSGKITNKEEVRPGRQWKYECVVKPGQTISFSCDGTGRKKEKTGEPYPVEFELLVSSTTRKLDGNILTKKIKESSVTYSYTVPENARTVYIHAQYDQGGTGQWYPCSVSITLNVEKKAETTTTPAPTQPTEVKPENYKGTYERHGGKMEYSFTNCKVTSKDDDWMTIVGNFHHYLTTTTGGLRPGSYITGNVKPGATMALACKKVKGNTTLDSVMIRVQAWNKNSTLINKIFRGKGSIQKSFQVPTNATGVSIDLVYDYIDAVLLTSIRLDVTKDLPDVPGSKFKWNTVANDDRCIHCKGQWSEYTIDNYPMAEYGTMCNSEKEWHKHNPNDWDITNIFYNDHIYTNGERFTLAKGEVIHNTYRDEELIFRGQTHAWLQKRLSNGSDRWVFYKGFVIGKHLKRSGKPSSSFETDELIVVPKGTIYILQKDDNSTKAYLLQGSMEVNNRKDNKKVTLKPGQVATGTKNGQMKVQTFDVKAMAKKYGISTSELQGVPSSTTTNPASPTTPTTPTTPNHHNNTNTAEVRRYDVERAIVKYKVTKGTEEGVMAKCFDNYGQLERRELKMGNQTTLQLTQGNNSYSLDTQAKTYTQVTNAELNFLNMNDPLMRKLKLQKKGTAKVLNRECTIYANSDTEFYVWKGIVLKKVAHTKKGITTTEATSVELPTSVDSKYFNMPSGYTIKN